MRQGGNWAMVCKPFRVPVCSTRRRLISKGPSGPVRLGVGVSQREEPVTIRPGRETRGIEAEAELQKALDGQEVAWQTWTSAEARQCDGANLAECRTCQATDTVCEPSSGEDGSQGTGGEDEQFDAGWAAEEHQLQQLARGPPSFPGQEPEAAIAQDTAIGEAEAEEAEAGKPGAESTRVSRKRPLR